MENSYCDLIRIFFVVESCCCCCCFYSLQLIVLFRKKTTCQKRFKDNDEFEKATCQFNSQRSLVIFLLNIVLNVKDLWEHYCFCDKVGVLPCSVCQFRAVYLNDEYDIYENLFDLNFLLKFQSHVCRNLRSLLEIDCHMACQLISRKYFYVHKDWFDGSLERFYLPFGLDIYEHRKINDIKNKDSKIVLDPLPLKKYFFK